MVLGGCKSFRLLVTTNTGPNSIVSSHNRAVKDELTPSFCYL